MKTSSIFTVVALLASTNAQVHDKLPTSASNDIPTAQKQLQTLISYASMVAKSRMKSPGSKCNPNNIQVRREWGSLSAKERIAYTDAVLCVQKKKARSPASWAPGAKTRFDDYVAAHVDLTMEIHYSGTFLGWHRYFVSEYEHGLRNECNYTGTQPYWNWGLSAETGLENSPLWDGSSTSLGGNGQHVEQPDQIYIGGKDTPGFVVSTGTGGGCVTSGPFVNMTVNLGPVGLDVPGINTTAVANPDGPFAYNPRCLRRDLSDEVNQRFANATAIVDTILRYPDIASFQNFLQGGPGTDTIGIHGGGHFSIGGDPGRDVFTSPGDPGFWPLHAMIDLVWHVWQMLDPETRIFGDNAISGTNTFLNKPPSANTTFDTELNIRYAGSGRNATMREVMSTVDGPYCYVYA
jgi:tyrosinase